MLSNLVLKTDAQGLFGPYGSHPKQCRKEELGKVEIRTSMTDTIPDDSAFIHH